MRGGFNSSRSGSGGGWGGQGGHRVLAKQVSLPSDAVVLLMAPNQKFVPPIFGCLFADASFPTHVNPSLSAFATHVDCANCTSCTTVQSGDESDAIFDRRHLSDSRKCVVAIARSTCPWRQPKFSIARLQVRALQGAHTTAPSPFRAFMKQWSTGKLLAHVCRQLFPVPPKGGPSSTVSDMNVDMRRPPCLSESVFDNK